MLTPLLRGSRSLPALEGKRSCGPVDGPMGGRADGHRPQALPSTQELLVWLPIRLRVCRETGSAPCSPALASPGHGPSRLWGKRGGTTRGPDAAPCWVQSPRGLALEEGLQLPLLACPQPQTRFALSPQNLSPDKIFHVIVAPCYDKKLEALREDFPTAPHGFRSADCVLTSGEGAWVLLGPLVVVL